MNPIPEETLRAYARTVFHEAQKYGFSATDQVRLINALIDLAATGGSIAHDPLSSDSAVIRKLSVGGFPLLSERLQIRRAGGEADIALIESWIEGPYGEHFLLSCAAAQRHDVRGLITNPLNAVGIVSLHDGNAIGAVAFLDIDHDQHRAELRKLIGVADQRGKGYAEEATLLWIEYGRRELELQKIYLSTLQTHLRNIKLNESIGFRVEGVLRNEVLLDGQRHDVLRMGLSF